MDTSKMNESVTSINKMGFDQVWKGSYYTAQRDSLNDAMTKLTKCIEDVNTFNKALEKLEEYIKICERIQELYRAMSSCSSSHTKEQNENGCGTCSGYASEISQKETQRKALRQEIIGILGKFAGIDVEIAEPADFKPADVEEPEEPEMPDVLPNYDPLAVTNPDYDGLLLTPSQGRKKNGPQAEETWYDLDMGYVTERMETEYGIPIETWVDQDTGLKMCRRVGEEEEYIMVAADVHNVWSGVDRNPDATYSMGDVVLTSWGPAMVVDYCGEAVQYREQGKPNRFDIAVAWENGYYGKGQAYAEEANARTAQDE